MSGTGRIADLVARLERMGSEEWRAKLSLKMATEARKLIDAGFDRRADPYGSAWRARKGRYSWPLLEKSGDMRRGWQLVKCDATGFRFINMQDYAPFQYYGTRKGIDPREMFPSEAFGLGKWKQALNQVVANEVRDLLRGK